MLFNSGEFVFFFLPITFLLFLFARFIGTTYVFIVLLLASLFFYAWTEISWVFILIFSILGNFYLARWLTRTRSLNLLTLGIAANLATLGYFKYADFLLENINALTNSSYPALGIVLPIGISFFTFQQIVYLVDSYKGQVESHRFLQYSLFVSFFPQLIAGPIVHYREMFPQLAERGVFRVKWINIQVGLAIFSIGLFKKIILADNIEIYATVVFDAAKDGQAVTFLEAWGGALAYSFQIYFDFSGYSDMAIGLARLFGIRLPLNFDSPYKAVNIIDFWRRWHMTLSRFLREYLYFPLGGNKKGVPRRYCNMMIVMLLGGLWHGAAWNFVLWGAAHGFFLIINHAWRKLLGTKKQGTAVGLWAGRVLTLMAVVVAWVLFRSENLDAAMAMLSGMVAMNGLVLDAATYSDLGVAGPLALDLGWTLDPSRHLMFAGTTELKWLAALLFVAWFLPNTQELFADFDPAVDFVRRRETRVLQAILWRPNMVWSAITLIMLLLCLPYLFTERPFLYFQF